MTTYEFHGDNTILELNHNGKQFFVELESQQIISDPEEVKEFFANAGILEKCPIE